MRISDLVELNIASERERLEAVALTELQDHYLLHGARMSARSVYDPSALVVSISLLDSSLDSSLDSGLDILTVYAMYTADGWRFVPSRLVSHVFSRRDLVDALRAEENRLQRARRRQAA